MSKPKRELLKDLKEKAYDLLVAESMVKKELASIENEIVRISKEIKQEDVKKEETKEQSPNEEEA